MVCAEEATEGPLREIVTASQLHQQDPCQDRESVPIQSSKGQSAPIIP